MSNPYQSPSAPQGQGGPEEHATGTVYSGQKLLIYSILGYFIAMPFLRMHFWKGQSNNRLPVRCSPWFWLADC